MTDDEREKALARLKKLLSLATRGSGQEQRNAAKSASLVIRRLFEVDTLLGLAESEESEAARVPKAQKAIETLVELEAGLASRSSPSVALGALSQAPPEGLGSEREKQMVFNAYQLGFQTGFVAALRGDPRPAPGQAPPPPRYAPNTYKPSEHQRAPMPDWTPPAQPFYGRRAAPPWGNGPPPWGRPGSYVPPPSSTPSAPPVPFQDLGDVLQDLERAEEKLRTEAEWAKPPRAPPRR